MRSRRTWITGSGRGIACWVDEPVIGQAVGAVVVVPSFGLEAEDSYRTPRSLAAEAVRAGFIGVTMSLTGDGDSQSLDGVEDLGEAWVADVEAVVMFAAQLAPGTPTHVVGLRLGAAVAASAHAPSRDGVTVCWEPISGRQFLRKQVMLRKLSMSSAPLPATVGIEVPGYVLTPGQAASVRSLRGVKAGPEQASHVRVRHEVDRNLADRIAGITSYFAEVPQAAIREIALDLPGGPLTRILDWRQVDSAVFDRAQSAPIIETFCEIEPLGLPAVRTESPNITPGAVVLFTAQGVERSSGPGSLWARTARELAVQGVVSVRADRRLTGGLIDTTAVREANPFTQDAIDDVTAAIDFARLDGVSVIGVGSCAGAWLLVRAAQDSPLDGIVAASIPAWTKHVDFFDRHYLDSWHGPHPSDIELDTASTTPDPVSRRARAAKILRQFRTRLRPVKSIMLGARDAGGAPLLRALPVRTAIYVLHGGQDALTFLGAGGHLVGALRRVRGATTHVVNVVDLEHSLRTETGRRHIVATIDRAVTELTSP